MSNDISRRLVLSGLTAGIVALSGCSSSGSDTPEPTEVGDPETPVDAPADTERQTPTEEQPEETPEEPSEETREESENQGPEPPEPRFVVARDGSGDYDTLQDAYDVAADGDVIEIGSGAYSYQPSLTTVEPGRDVIEKSLVFVGQAADDTTVSISAPSYEDKYSEGELNYHHDNDQPQFWNLTLETQSQLEFNGGDESPRFYYCRVPVSTIGYINTEAYDTVFTGSFDLDTKSPAQMEVTKCTFRGEATIADDAENCVFESTFYTPFPDEQFTGTNCEFRNGVIIRDGEAEISDSTISARNGSGIAVDVRQGFDSEIVDSEIAGKIVADVPSDDSRYASRLETVRGCEFTNPGGLDYFIDGIPVKNLWLNAFVGADIRLEELPDTLGPKWEELNVYDSDNEVGNYYSEWDGGEDRGDGISELPRPIPGPADAVDQYPLMDSDLSRYR